VNVVDRIAAHTLEQTYWNEEQSEIEAKYTFPLPENATVVEFAATFGDGRTITGNVQRQEVAKREYQQAIQQGRHAALLEEDRPDIFETSIGNLRAGEQVVVKVQYCLELPVEDDSVRLTIPSHVGARYSPEPRMAGDSCESLVYHPNGSGAPFSATVMCEMGDGRIPAISSPTNPSIQVQQGELVGRVTAQVTEASLSKDIVICIKPENLFQPVIAWEEWSKHGTQALMLSLVPKFELPMIEKPDVVFVVDCSGSMNGQRIEQSKRAMQIFMRSMPEGCRFNIVKFGHSFKFLSQQSLEYCDENIDRASSYINEIGADMGGTEILKPLEFVHSLPSQPGYSRQVIVLTDGQVRNERQVIDFAGSTQSRVFSLGIGSGVSTFLVKGLARVTNGHASFVQDNEKLEPVCIALLRKALTPAVTNIQISWPKVSETEPESVASKADADVTEAGRVLSFFDPAQTDSRAYGVRSSAALGQSQYQQAPKKPPPVHADSNFVAFALYPSGVRLQGSVDTEVRITGDTPAGKLALSIPLPSGPVPRLKPMVHRMAARALIRDLEDEPSNTNGTSEEAISLSLQFSVLCQGTSFVAVDSQNGATYSADVKKRVVPQPNPSRTLYAGSSMGGYRCSGMQLCTVSAEVASAELCSASNPFRTADKRRSATKKSAAFQPPSFSGMFRRLFSSTSEAAPEQATRAALGGSSSMYYDVEKKRWRERGMEAATEEAAALAPPPMAAPALSSMEQHVNLAKSEAEQISPVSRMKALESLLCLAAANGSFRPAAQSILGVTDESLRAWASELGISMEVLLTALVLVYLRHEYPKEKSTWMLVAQKSTKWLGNQENAWKTDTLPDVDALISKVASLHFNHSQTLSCPV
jgi:hypothetical protein